MKTSLSPRDLATAVGVSESSLKRWADSGRIHVSRTAGGHRRIPIQEAIRFARETRMPILRPDLLGLPTLDPKTTSIEKKDPAQAFHDELARGDSANAQAILIDLYLSGHSVADLCDGPIRQAMTVIGKEWNHDSEGIFIEHRATDICLQALNVLRSLINSPARPDPHDAPRPVAVGGAPGRDPYLIPSLMCACVLSDVGYHTINLGGRTPDRVLHSAVKAHHPRLVWLACASYQATPTPKEIAALAREFSAHDARLVVGGQALDPATLAAYPHLVHCLSMNELEKFARGLMMS